MNYENLSEQLKFTYELYKDDEVLLEQLSKYIMVQLPLLMTNKKEKEEKKRNLETQKNSFINNFIYSGVEEYFYLRIADIFINYDGEHFKIINGSDLVAKILKTINLNKELRIKKQPIKNTILKKIKANPLFGGIPNTYTIQHVLNNLTPIIFKNKNLTKYFLCVLGDSILNKQIEVKHYINSCELVKFVGDTLYDYFKNTIKINKTIINNLSCDTKIQNIRLINLNSNVNVTNYCKNFIDKYILDIFVVAVHYSNRYKNSEIFLKNSLKSKKLKNYIGYFENNTTESIFSNYFDKNFTKIDNVEGVSKNEAYYLWINYLRELEIPDFLCFNNFVSLMKKWHVNYSEDKCKFINIVSNFKFIKTFRQFSEDTITTGVNIDDEYEIGELMDLIKEWSTENNYLFESINEQTLLSMFQHILNIESQNNKTLKHIRCDLWDKMEHMTDILEEVFEEYGILELNQDKSIYSLYQDYCDKATIKSEIRVVSKHYFIKHINKVIPEEYLNNKCISKNYWVKESLNTSCSVP